ncbi:hypothetical protein HZS_308, partial [Henneguya salminicola]
MVSMMNRSNIRTIKVIYSYIKVGNNFEESAMFTNINDHIKSKLMPLFGWGSNGSGQLGTGDNIDQSELAPIKIFDDINISQIAGGGSHTVLLYQDGSVYTSGKNTNNQLCRSTDSQSDFVFKKAEVYEKVIYIACGWDNTILIFENKILLYGSNVQQNICSTPAANNFIGKNIISLKFPSTSNEEETTSSNSIVLCCIGRTHILFLSAAGMLFSWGVGKKGQLGLGSFIHQTDKITKIPFFENIKVIHICSGWEFSIAVTDKHDIYVWGCNKFGQCSIIGPRYISSPIQFLAVGVMFYALRVKLGKIYTWGRNDFGQCGSSVHPCPVQIFDIFIRNCQIACGAEHSLIFDAFNNTLYSMGWNEHNSCLIHGKDYIRSLQSIVLDKDLPLYSRGLLAS